MAGPEDSLKFDPSRTPFTTPVPQFTYMQHEQAGLIKLNPDTMKVSTIHEKPYPNMPLKLPKAISDIDQSAIRTCSIPSTTNKGCDSAVNGGCPLINRYGRGCGPFNMIVEKNGIVDSSRCFAVYCGVTDSGRPASQAHLLMDGWRIVTDRTTIPERTVRMVGDKKVYETLIREVPDLPPFYEEAKVGRFADEKKPKRGRPRKVPIGTA